MAGRGQELFSRGGSMKRRWKRGPAGGAVCACVWVGRGGEQLVVVQGCH